MNKHFSNKLIDEIEENPNKNYFTNVINETIKITKSPKKSLDVGCGNGVFTQILKTKFNSEITGLDGNEYALQQCRKRGFDKTFLIEDFSQDSLSMLQDMSFDLAISKDVLEHIYNPEHTINEIWKKIKKGGFLLIHVPNHFPFFARLRFLFKNNLDTFNYFPSYSRYNFPHIRFFTYKSIKELLSKFEYEVTANFSYNFFVFPLLGKLLNEKIKQNIIKNFPDHFSESYTLLIKKL